MNPTRRQLLALLATFSTPFMSAGEFEQASDTTFRPGNPLRSTGGPTVRGEIPADPGEWDVYFAANANDVMPFISMGDSWEPWHLALPEIDTQQITGVADHVVTTATGLQSAFDNIGDGDTVWIGSENAPYRTTQWLDIDANGVTVIGPGIGTAIKPADGANVGGIRIGHNNPCRNVTVRNIGYDGNTEQQSGSAKRLHGVIVRDATNVVVTGNTITRTHPYGEHGSGGSGISVERNAENVRIMNNRVHHFGDRGIQLAGHNIIVSENVVTDGIDRAIAGDLWTPSGRNDVANSVIISGNILGNCSEGSLTGIASGPEGEPGGGSHSIITDNIGFGFHKSFCHVRGPTAIHNVSIRGNVSTQSTDGLATNGTTKFAGIAVDPAGGSRITIAGNELSGYSRHGINVQSPVTDWKIANNTVLNPAEVGIRVQNGAEGTIIDNTVTQTGTEGVLLDGTESVTVSNNHVREVGRTGIMVRSDGETYHEVSGNYVSRFNGAGGDGVPGIRIESSKTGVRGNTISRTQSLPAIAEAEGVTGNVYENNRADESNSWRISSPSAIVRNHVPAFDVHRGFSDDDSSGQIHVTFDKPYNHAPKVSFGRRAGGIQNIEYTTSDDGMFTGANINIAAAGGTIDVFVEAS